MRTLRFILLCTLFLWKEAGSQELNITPDLRFENFNSERNFTSVYINNLTVDRKGYLWAAANGLLRFDGVHLQQYTNFNNQYHGLKSNYNDDILEDSAGRLWIGNAMGLCYYNNSLGKFHYVNIDSAHPVSYAYSFLLQKDKMWFTCNRGLCSIDLGTLKISQTSLQLVSDPIEVFSLDNFLLGISTRTGLYIYDTKNDYYEKKIFPFHDDIFRIRQCIYNDGKYWAATNHGLCQLEKDGSAIHLLPGTEQLSISSMAFYPADKEKILWLGTTNNGLQLFNTRLNKIDYQFHHDEANPNSLQSNNISAMHVDRMQRLWLGTEKGASLFDPGNQSWKTRKVDFTEGITTNNEIEKIVQDKFKKDMVWMSCLNQGILQVDWKTKQLLRQYKNFPTSLSLSFPDMLQLDNGTWILLAKNKLITWDPGRGVLQMNDQFSIDNSVPARLEVKKIIPTTPDELYIATNAGLYLYHPSTNTLHVVLKRTGNDVFSSLDLVNGVFDDHEILWLASRKGLVRYNIRLKEEKDLYNKVEDEQWVNYLNDISISPKGLVLCANGRGVSLFDNTQQRFLTFTEFGSIHNPGCHAIFVKDSVAWINSEAGLLKIDLVTKKASCIEMTRFTSIYSPVPFGHVNDELVIGYRNMYAYFNPFLLSRQAIPSVPVIEKIFLNNKPLYDIPGENKYSFTYLQNSFSFYFTAFEFNNPEQIHFRYKLEGHDHDWTYQDEQRTATYIRLPPGHYRFIVEAGNGQDEWNQTSAFFPINIIPPFWQRWWFWPSLGSLFVLAVIMIARKRINTIRKREEEKTAANISIAGLETKLLRSQMNPHFIFNSLNSIQKYIWENKEEDAAEYLARFAKLIRGILENSRKETITLKEELDMIKLYVELEHRRSNGKFEYFIKTAETLDIDNILIPPMLLQPFIENAIWHGLNKKENKGHLYISIAAKGKQLECIIDDDGAGRSADARSGSITGKKSLGMEITKHRVELLHQSSNQTADIRITDKEVDGKPSGTTIAVVIPLQYNRTHA